MTHEIPVVQVRDLFLRFGAREVLRSLSLEVRAGDFLAVIGPNGSGKTSLVKCLLGVLRPTSGSVQIFGSRPAAVDPRAIGYVPQVKTMERQFPALALELVVSGLRRRWPVRISGEERDHALAALRRVGADHLSDRSLAALSGGELQRVFLARSIVRRPQLMILDEPEAGIDVSGTADLYDLLEEYQERHGATVLMVTHDWNVAYHHSSHVLLLTGDQYGFGPPGDVLTEGNLREAFGHVGHSHGMLHGGDDA